VKPLCGKLYRQTEKLGVFKERGEEKLPVVYSGAILNTQEKRGFD